MIGIARNPEKLQRALKYGADFVISTQDKQIKDIRNEFREICKKNGLEAGFGWKIFEVSGTKAGQDLALELLSFTGKLILIGFGMAKNEYSISRLMAFDAEMIGTWGCLPEYYPIVLDMVLYKEDRYRALCRDETDESDCSPSLTKFTKQVLLRRELS